MSRLKISNPATTDMKVTEQLLLSMWRERAGIKGHRVNWRSLPPQHITFFHKSRIMTQGRAFVPHIRLSPTCLANGHSRALLSWRLQNPHAPVLQPRRKIDTEVAVGSEAAAVGDGTCLSKHDFGALLSPFFLLTPFLHLGDNFFRVPLGDSGGFKEAPIWTSGYWICSCAFSHLFAL